MTHSPSCENHGLVLLRSLSPSVMPFFVFLSFFKFLCQPEVVLTVSERFSQSKQHTLSPRVEGCAFETSYQGRMLIKPFAGPPRERMTPARPSH